MYRSSLTISPNRRDVTAHLARRALLIAGGSAPPQHPARVDRAALRAKLPVSAGLLTAVHWRAAKQRRWRMSVAAKLRTGLLVIIVVVVVIAGFVVVKHSMVLRTGVGASGFPQGSAAFGWRDVDFMPLSGTLVTTPVTDWSFVNKQNKSGVYVDFRVHPWYHIPYNVTTAIATSRDGRRLYLYSYYYPPATAGQANYRDRFPEARAWNRHVMRDPRIRLRIADQLFDCLVYPLTDVDEIEDVRGSILAGMTGGVVRKDAEGPEEKRGRLYIFRVIPEWSTDAVKSAHARARSGVELVNVASARSQ